jgi:hypothetical protein
MPKETNAQRFKRVGEKRVQNIINSIRSLSQLANKRIYEWDKDQLAKIWEALDKEIKACKKSFDDPGSSVFKL